MTRDPGVFRYLTWWCQLSPLFPGTSRGTNNLVHDGWRLDSLTHIQILSYLVSCWLNRLPMIQGEPGCFQWGVYLQIKIISSHCMWMMVWMKLKTFVITCTVGILSIAHKIVVYLFENLNSDFFGYSEKSMPRPKKSRTNRVLEFLRKIPNHGWLDYGGAGIQ